MSIVSLDRTVSTQANLEKVIRLRQLLIEFHKHPFLRNRLVLKGGTAINLFYLDLARLSVDIDLNYIAPVDREKMLAERPDVVRAAEQIPPVSDIESKTVSMITLCANGTSGTPVIPARRIVSRSKSTSSCAPVPCRPESSLLRA